MKHIVVGGNGFTGAYLVESLLRRGEEVVVCDREKDASLPIYRDARFMYTDITKDKDAREIPCGPDDVVHHMAARQYHIKVPVREQTVFFQEVNLDGTKRLLQHMAFSGCHKLIYFSTDMVYGLPQSLPVTTEHQRQPIGPYGASKCKSEDLCQAYRDQGMHITIFRPRLIIGPGRLGILTKLFSLIDKNLWVPLIGDGSNHYQMVSVLDCVTAVENALDKEIPNKNYNLGSKNPPTVEELLSRLIESVGSKSRLVKTPAWLVKGVLKVLESIGVPLLYKEQYMIADVNYQVDISSTENELGWCPRYNDQDMIYQAYKEYKRLALRLPHN